MTAVRVTASMLYYTFLYITIHFPIFPVFQFFCIPISYISFFLYTRLAKVYFYFIVRILDSYRLENFHLTSTSAFPTLTASVWLFRVSFITQWTSVPQIGSLHEYLEGWIDVAMGRRVWRPWFLLGFYRCHAWLIRTGPSCRPPVDRPMAHHCHTANVPL